MRFIRALCCCACGGFGMLVLAGAAPVPPADVPTKDSGDPAATIPAPAETAPSADSADTCLADPHCVDTYLWSLYERTPKVDTVTVSERTKVTVKRKGKTKTVTKTTAKLVGEDFAWKDPKAATLAGMPTMDYVIGGMDPGFRLTLYRALRALDDAGFKPGIMCAFRDDYRQSIATGLKAQNDRSYHGGSFRGGYGHGMAADIVSVKGETRTDRLAVTAQMWEYIDAHEKELGIGRPYLDRDPPHVGPIDGQEYADKRLKPKIQHAEAEAKKNRHLAVHTDTAAPKSHKAVHVSQNVTKHDKVAKHSRAQSKTRAPTI
jgi:hypothetical protein